MDIDFQILIDRYIDAESSEKKTGKYYPFEIGKCIRKTWYTYKYPKEKDPKLRRIFRVGKILHDFIIQVIKSYKTSEVELIKSEIPFKYRFKDFIISGRIDHLVMLKADGKIVIVEVKSSKNVDRIETPMDHHSAQLQFYMYVTGIHNGILIYIDKNNLSAKSFNIEFSEKAGEKILQKFTALHNNLIKDKLPPPEAKTRDKGWMCDYCEYKEKCRKNEN